ncbi:MAG: DUF5057 domain-containing protein [Bacillota bacterium]|nr:DUF5057 domain-containing protein [Bacillota bacterium]
MGKRFAKRNYRFFSRKVSAFSMLIIAIVVLVIPSTIYKVIGEGTTAITPISIKTSIDSINYSTGTAQNNYNYTVLKSGDSSSKIGFYEYDKQYNCIRATYKISLTSTKYIKNAVITQPYPHELTLANKGIIIDNSTDGINYTDNGSALTIQLNKNTTASSPTPTATPTSSPTPTATPSSVVSSNPTTAVAGQSITITYNASGRVLQNSSTLKMHWGYDGWTVPTDTVMTSVGSNIWTATITVPSAAKSGLNVCFTNGSSWDNNNSANWTIPVTTATPTAAPTATPVPTVSPTPKSTSSTTISDNTISQDVTVQLIFNIATDTSKNNNIVPGVFQLKPTISYMDDKGQQKFGSIDDGTFDYTPTAKVYRKPKVLYVHGATGLKEVSDIDNYAKLASNNNPNVPSASTRQPSDETSAKDEIYSNDKFDVVPMSIQTFIGQTLTSINGQYDAIYFGKGIYVSKDSPVNTGIYDMMYKGPGATPWPSGKIDYWDKNNWYHNIFHSGSDNKDVVYPTFKDMNGNSIGLADRTISAYDITDRMADKVMEFIKSNQLVIFNNDVLGKDTSTNSNISQSFRYNDTIKTVFARRFKNIDTQISVNNITKQKVYFVNNLSEIQVPDNGTDNGDTINAGDTNNSIVFKAFDDLGSHRPYLKVTASPASFKNTTVGKSGDQNSTLSFSFEAYNYNNDNDLTALIYLDKNSDGKFGYINSTGTADLELAYSPITLKNGVQTSVVVPKPKSNNGTFFSGMLYWEIAVTDDANDNQVKLSNVIDNPYYSTGTAKKALDPSGESGQKDFCMDSILSKNGIETNINVLQLTPDSNNNGDLQTLFKNTITDSNGTHTINEVPGVAKVNVTPETVSNFIKNGDYSKLNQYDMLVLGFQDNYYQNLDFYTHGGNVIDPNDPNKKTRAENAVIALKNYINSGKGVLFTHDTIHGLERTDATTFNTNTETTMNIRNNFLDAVGLKWQSSKYAIDGIWSNNSNDYTLRSQEYGSGYNGTSFDYLGTNTVRKVNTGLIVDYPYDLDTGKTGTQAATLNVANTHVQWYRLNLNKADPWYNLYPNSGNKGYEGYALDTYDAENSYYTYSLGNITVSGTGHSTLGATDELRLFVNTCMRAYASSNHSPYVNISSPADNSFIDKNSQVIQLIYQNNDFDVMDEKSINRVYVRDNSVSDENAPNAWIKLSKILVPISGYSQIDTSNINSAKNQFVDMTQNQNTALTGIHDGITVNNGVNKVIGIPKIISYLDSNGIEQTLDLTKNNINSSYKIKIEAEDSSGATGEQIVTVIDSDNVPKVTINQIKSVLDYSPKTTDPINPTADHLSDTMVLNNTYFDSNNSKYNTGNSQGVLRIDFTFSKQISQCTFDFKLVDGSKGVKFRLANIIQDGKTLCGQLAEKQNDGTYQKQAYAAIDPNNPYTITIKPNYLPYFQAGQQYTLYVYVEAENETLKTQTKQKIVQAAICISDIGYYLSSNDVESVLYNDASGKSLDNSKVNVIINKLRIG